MLATLAALLLLAAPELRLEGGLPARAEQVAREGWTAAERAAAAEGLAAPASPRPVRIGTSAEVGGASSGASRAGFVALRPGLDLADERGRSVLRHELAHQYLFAACPAASADALFQEAFALSVTGEAEVWNGGEYLPVARALERLARARSLDTSEARRALSRLLAEAPGAAGRLPTAVARRLAFCEAGAAWEPFRPEHLADARTDAGDALVVLSRHSGEVLRAEGATTLPLPFGSTLKPFLLAGATSPPPPLPPDETRPGWRCGPSSGPMDASTALLRSCNGWFLDWAAREPGVVRFGAWGPALRALGLTALPSDASEAIGVRPSLRLSALGLAGAYRLLAEARPDLLDLLSRNAREGTLAGVGAAEALSGVAVKTGTVLDGAGNPRLGWMAAVDRDVVVVLARARRTPRTFAGELAEVLAKARAEERGAARVQVFGLLAPGDVTARCPEHGFAVGGSGPLALEGEVRLGDVVAKGTAVCVGSPWLVTVPGAPGPRPYAGVFTGEPLAQADARSPAPQAAGATAREARARRGSDLVFRTTRLLYAAGVVAAEDAAAQGEARVALARVADANGRHPRHPGRPVCDTTHCQAFLGTARPGREERTALARPLEAGDWLPFSRGGQEPWTEVRPRAAVERALGPGARGLAFGRGRVRFVASAGDGTDRWEETREVGCEVLRGPLKLPGCPQGASTQGEEVVFQGRGAGHGEGLDLEWAKRSGLSAEAILERSYRRGAR